MIAGIGLGWMLATLLGAEYDWSLRLRGLFDLIALAGFGWAAVTAIGFWRHRHKQEQEDNARR